jgi:centromere protein S
MNNIQMTSYNYNKNNNNINTNNTFDETTQNAFQNAIDEHIHFDVHHIAQAVEQVQQITFSKQMIFCVKELAITYAEQIASDLQAFATHAKRSNIHVDDVLLKARSNANLKLYLSDFNSASAAQKQKKTNSKSNINSNPFVAASTTSNKRSRKVAGIDNDELDQGNANLFQSRPFERNPPIRNAELSSSHQVSNNSRHDSISNTRIVQNNSNTHSKPKPSSVLVVDDDDEFT